MCTGGRVKSNKGILKCNGGVIEKGRLENMAYKLNESTINALNYYAEHGYKHFKDSATFCKVIRDWFSTVNVKSTDYGKRERDEHRCPIRREKAKEDLPYITKFVDWLEKWKNSGTPGLSQPTFEAVTQTCKAVLSLVPYLFEHGGGGSTKIRDIYGN